MDPLKSKFQVQQMRELPHNLEAEQSLLGALMLNNECFEDVSDIISPTHFFVPINGEIFAAISKLISQGLVADPITLRSYFEKSDNLQKIESGSYLIQLVNSVVSVSGIEDYARLIYDLYNRRQLILIGEDIVHDASTFDLNLDSESLIEKAEARLYDLAMDNTRGVCISFSDVAKTAMQTIELAYKSDNKLIGVTSGFIDLNRKLGGLNR